MTTSQQPAGYQIRTDVRIGGVIYSPGEPFPQTATEAEIASALAQGQIAPIDAFGDPLGDSPRAPKVELRTPEQYLAAQDGVVLRRLREAGASRDMIERVLERARQGGRAFVLLEALQLALAMPKPGPRKKVETETATEVMA